MSKRQIDKNGLMFRTAYFGVTEENWPKKVNLCRFVWRAVFVCLFLSLVACVVAIASFVAVFVLYHIVLFVWWLLVEFQWGTLAESATTPSAKVLWLVFLGYVALCGFLAYLMLAPPYIRRWAVKFETVRLIRDYIRAKKKKICPMYDVV